MGICRVKAIRPNEIEGLWPMLSSYIEKALDQTMYEQTLEEVKDKGASGQYIFLLFEDSTKILGLMTMEMYDYPSGKVAGIVHLSGEDFDGWIDEADYTSKRIAKEHGAKEMIIVGRKGWAKKLIEYGYKVQYMVLKTTL